jgi:hypothetical protein
MQQLPEFMRLAGLDWREALPADLKRIVCDWQASGLQRFINGKDNPFPDQQATIDKCRHQAGVAEAPWPSEFEDMQLRARNISTLKAIWETRGKFMIRREIEISRPLVVFDVDSPETILGWACPSFRYVIHSMRGQGIGSALKVAVCGD